MTQETMTVEQHTIHFLRAEVKRLEQALQEEYQYGDKLRAELAEMRG